MLPSRRIPIPESSSISCLRYTGSKAVCAILARSWRKDGKYGRQPTKMRRSSLAGFLLCGTLSECGYSSVGHLDPLGVGRGLGAVVVVPVPPLVRRTLRITLWRVLPGFLTAERSDIEVAPDAAHRLVAAVVDEVRAKHAIAVAEKHIVAMPFTNAEVLVEGVGNGVPRHLPAHPLLQTCDIRLGRA